MLVDGCSSTHQIPFAVHMIKRMRALTVRRFPSRTARLSRRPSGRDLDRNVLPLLLGNGWAV